MTKEKPAVTGTLPSPRKGDDCEIKESAAMEESSDMGTSILITKSRTVEQKSAKKHHRHHKDSLNLGNDEKGFPLVCG